MMTITTAEYRIRQVLTATRLFGTMKHTEIEWVVEQKRAPVEGEDDYSYQRDCWVRISDYRATEQEAKQFLIRWLAVEMEDAETAEDFA